MQIEQIIHDNIYRFGKRKRLFELFGNMAYAVLIFLVLWMSVILADRVFYFSRMTRWGLFFINMPLVLYLFYRYFFKPFHYWFSLKPSNDLTPVAALLGKYFPELRDTFVNMYQLSRFKTTAGTSEGLRRAAVASLAEKTKDIDFRERLRIHDYLPKLRLALPVLAGTLVLLSLQGDGMLRSTLRLLNPAGDYRAIPAFRFDVTPGSTDLIMGETFTVRAGYNGPALEACDVLLFQNDTYVRSVRMTQKADSFKAELNDIRQNMTYRLHGKPLYDLHLANLLVSDFFTIDVKRPPRISQMDLRLYPPAYSNLEPVQLERNVGDITALPGTEVHVKILADKPVREAVIAFRSGRVDSLDIRGEQLNGTFSIREADSYTIRLVDEEQLRNREPIVYGISVLPDRDPFVDIVSPGQDVESPLDVKMQVQVEARDDFGIDRIFLLYRYVRQNGQDEDSTWNSRLLNNFSGNKRQAEAYHLFDFDRMPISFNDAIAYYAMAYDNNDISGPGVGKSAIYYIRFPSIDEIFDSFAEEEAEEVERLDDVVTESENLKKDLEELNRDLKREQKLDWETQQQIEETVKKQKDLQKKLEDIQKELQDLVENLDRNNLISQDVLEKYMQIQELFREMVSPELLNSLQKLQDSLEKPDSRQVQRALEQFRQNQEVFKENVERTLELLKQVQLEQKMDQLVHQAEQLLEQQNKINEALKEENKADAGQVSDQLEQQKSGLENLERSLENLLREPRMNEFEQASEILEKVDHDIEDSKLSEQMNNLADQISRSDFTDSEQKSRKMSNTMQSMVSELQSAQQNLQQQHKQQVQKEMAAALKKMLELSFDQEKIRENTRSSSQFSDALQEMNREQGKLTENFQKLLSSIVELSRKTFFLDPSMNKALGKARNNMMESMGHLGERRKGQASRSQQKAMEGLNEAARGMQNALSQMSGASSGTGFEQFMEQLQKMSGMQGQINEGTMSMFPGEGNQGQMSMQQQAEMRRLAQQQKALQQALEEMAGQMDNRGDVLGRLGELGGEMEEVVEDLLSMKVDRKTIDRQRQILSRMLDAQKSVREREYSKKRKAERAGDYIARDPGDPVNMEDQKFKVLQEALKRALNEGYGPDYQELIEQYFKSLTEELDQSVE